MLEAKEKEAQKEYDRACADENKAWRMKEATPRDPAAYADATVRRARWHSILLRTVGELVDQRKILGSITDPTEQERWLADAVDHLKGDVNG